jgi:signal transduction histidine kinase/DNA-binding response OmpR family regulator
VRVLVADDDRAIGLALQMALEDLGHECLVAENGRAALEMFQQHGADAIISDWRMPGLEGPDLCRQVRSEIQSPYVYFILLTVLSEPRHILAGMEAGADDYLTKPFTIDALHARLIAAERVTHLHQTLAVRQSEQAQLAAERQRLIEQLRQERHQLESVIQQLPAGVVIATAPTGEVVMVNERVLQLWRHDDQIPPSTTEHQWRGYHPDGREYAPDEWPLMRSIQAGEVVTGEEVDIVWGDGTHGAIRISSAPIRDADHVVAAVSVLHDITDERRRQREAAQNDKLRALGQMAGGVAHDLNQSLALVSGYVELIRDAIEQPAAHEPADIMEMLRIITQAAYDGGETVKRLLTFSRAPTDSPAELVDLGVLLDDVAKLTAPRWRDAAQAEGRPITLRVEAEDSTVIDGWPGPLREALTNLIFNAVDALPVGGFIDLRAQQHDTSVVLEVHDSGVGMPPEVRERIFEPFFTTKGEQGTGLGLPMVFGIVERHQGHVTVESAPGHGTTIRMEFPMPDGRPAAAELAAQDAGPARRVLLVDDHAGIRMLVVRILSEHGHTVVPVESAEQALDILRVQTFDVLLTDVGLGEGMNGWQLATEARASWPQMHVILGTGWAAGIDPEAARALGIVEIIAKPYRVAELTRAIDAL